MQQLIAAFPPGAEPAGDRISFRACHLLKISLSYQSTQNPAQRNTKEILSEIVMTFRKIK